jgi:hypothetical protein
MRVRLLALLFLTAVAVFVVATGSAKVARADGKGPQTDVVAGEAQFAGLGAVIHINAQSGPNGEDARGHFSFAQTGSASFEGDVSCLNVEGNAAYAGGTIVSSDNPALVGQGFMQLTTDNGSPGTSDQSVTTQIGGPVPTTCPTPSPGGFTLTYGNYVVHDAD